MAWIESHQSLGRHPKTRKAARLLSVSRPAVVGHLQYLWWWCLDFAQDGDLGQYDDDEIAEAAEWDEDPATFIAALTEAGFLNADRQVHDWDDYAGKLIEQRKANAEKQKRWRERNKPDTSPAHNDPVTVTSPLRNGATVPNRTVPNPTEQNPTVPTPPVSPEPARPAGGGAFAPQQPVGVVRPLRPVRKPKDEPAPINPWWDALVAGIGITPATDTERNLYGKAVRDLRALNATPEDIAIRCDHYRRRWPNAELTPTALLKHWSRMEHAPPPPGGTLVVLENGATASPDAARKMQKFANVDLGVKPC